MALTREDTAQFSELSGQTLAGVKGLEEGSCRIEFKTQEGNVYALYHDQDGGESVEVLDIVGDVGDLNDAMVISSDQVDGESKSLVDDDGEEAVIYWTYYKIQTNKGDVSIRWEMCDNVFYACCVAFDRLN